MFLRNEKKHGKKLKVVATKEQKGWGITLLIFVQNLVIHTVLNALLQLV